MSKTITGTLEIISLYNIIFRFIVNISVKDIIQNYSDTIGAQTYPSCFSQSISHLVVYITLQKPNAYFPLERVSQFKYGVNYQMSNLIG
jgi:hypothetical protein